MPIFSLLSKNIIFRAATRGQTYLDFAEENTVAEVASCWRCGRNCGCLACQNFMVVVPDYVMRI